MIFFWQTTDVFFLPRYPLLELSSVLSSIYFHFSEVLQHLGTALDWGVREHGAMLDGIPKGKNTRGMVSQEKEHSGHSGHPGKEHLGHYLRWNIGGIAERGTYVSLTIAASLKKTPSRSILR